MAREPEAFKRLVARYGARMHATARSVVGSDHDAKDVVQDSLLAVYRHISTFSRRAPFGAWLRRVVVNHALMKLRMRKRRSETFMDDLPSAPAPNDEDLGRSWQEPTDEAIERRQRWVWVRRKIEALSPQHRRVLELRDLEELSTREAAKRLGISETCLKVRLFRARQALRALL